MKKYLAFFLITSLVYTDLAYATCEADKEKAKNSCSAESYKPIKNEIDAAMKACDESCRTNLAGEMSATATKYAAAKLKNDNWVAKCSSSRDGCSESCGADAASLDYARRMSGQEGKEYCEKEEPKKNEEGANQNGAAMMQALAGLLAAMMQRGQEPPKDAVSTVCNSATNTTATTGAAPSAAVAAVCPGIDKSTESDSSFADGTGRTVDGGIYEGEGGMATGTPAAGTPAQVQLSGAIPGNAAGGMGAGAAGGGSGGSGKDSGKKAGNGEEGSKLGSNPTGGGGSGGGSMAGMGKTANTGPGGPPTRTPVDGLEKSMAAAIEKAAQARGIASDGPLGGITGANSLDNFQKVEKRMQSERTNLNETN